MSKKLDVNEATIHIEEEGSGPDLVLVHGIGQSSARVWDYLVPELKDDYRILRYDLRGHGRSTNPSGDQSINQHAADLATILDLYDIEQANIAGFSFGGTVVQQFAIDYPSRLLNLILVTTAPGLTDDAAEYYEERAKFIEENGVEAHADKAVSIVLSPWFIEKHPDIADEYRERFLDNKPKAYAGAMRAMIGWDPTEQLRELDHQTLVIGGELDDTAIMGEETAASSRKLHNLISDSQLEIIPDTTHYPQIEKPETVATLIDGFLSETQ
jgi:pimeloyl-ACP methyl ester carboxylesterase